MKSANLLFVLLCPACSNAVDFETVKSVITKLIDDHTKCGASEDSVNWAKCLK